MKIISTSKVIIKDRLRKFSTIECFCGNVFTIRTDSVGKIQSCGCKTHGKHNGVGTKIYKRWESMKKRCTQPSCDKYKYYGGKGITVSEEFLDFAKFREWALSNGYSDELQIDRIDNSKGYSSENCRWVTRKQNMRNKSDNILLKINDDTKNLSEWCEVFNTPYQKAYQRLRRGWETEKIFA